MQRFLIIIMLILGGVLGIILLIRASQSHSSAKMQSIETAKNTLSDRVNIEPKKQIPGGPYEPEDPRWKWWHDMEKKDPKFEWKTLINFYGKVVDYDTGMPIEGAEVDLTWTDLSWNGSSERKIYTDIHGNFSMTNARGKNLGVSGLKKKGYLRSNAEQQLSFEYAGFWEKSYHQPDSSTPVIFRMKKKGVAEALVHKEGEIFIEKDKGEILIHLDQETVLYLKLLENETGTTENWAIRVSIPNGGIQISTEEFPYTAPQNNYQSSLILDLKTEKPKKWVNLYEGGQFYVKTTAGNYARLELKMISGKNFIEYTLFLNPTPGHRNLEYDKNKQVKVP